MPKLRTDIQFFEGDTPEIRLEKLRRLAQAVESLRLVIPVLNTLQLVDGVPAPGAVVGVATIYVDVADGDLKIRFGNGTIKTIATNP